MTGDENDDVIGDSGSDSVLGEGGADELVGYLGDDLPRGGQGNDTLLGGHMNDTLYGDDEIVVGYEGDDLLIGNLGFDTITDFEAADAEQIDCSSLSGVFSFYDRVNNHHTDVAGGVEISNGSDTLLLEGLSSAQFRYGLTYAAEDFVF